MFTNDEHLHDICVSLRVQGRSKSDKYDNIICGFNSRLDTIQAAILIPKLKAFKEKELDEINSIATKYSGFLKDTVCIPVVPEGYASSWSQYTIRVNDAEIRRKLVAYLSAKGIQTAVYYPRALHEQGAFTAIKTASECPNAINATKEVLSLPIHPYMTDEEVFCVSEAIRSFFRREYSEQKEPSICHADDCGMGVLFRIV